jgi:hypothetical protein
MSQQTTDHLLMIRPAHFGRNSETVADNSFQDLLASAEYDRVAAVARVEFDAFAKVLTDAGIRLTIVEDRDEPITPDAVFCNNWFSTHDDGLLVTYPMYWPQRRRERRMDIIELFDQKCIINRTMALDHWEEDGRFLESTGSLVLDRVNRVAYACLSNRCDENAVFDWCAAMSYKPITFQATDAAGRIVYHNNVIMAIGSWLVPICLEAITDAGERAKVREAILIAGRKIMELTPDQVEHFAGNMLEASTPAGPVWIMSTQAYTALTPEQRALLRADGTRIAHSPINTIETYGGGSARCMVGEIFLAAR